jgi:hypothetical protein
MADGGPRPRQCPSACDVGVSGLRPRWEAPEETNAMDPRRKFIELMNRYQASPIGKQKPFNYYCPNCSKEVPKGPGDWALGELSQEEQLFIAVSGGQPPVEAWPDRECPACGGAVRARSIIDGDYDRPEDTKDGGDCFIATAACGTGQVEDVARLRRFRDLVLRPTWLGCLLIRCYTILSPPLARLIGRWSWTRLVARSLVVRPARWLADWFLERKLRAHANEMKREQLRPSPTQQLDHRPQPLISLRRSPQRREAQ